MTEFTSKGVSYVACLGSLETGFTFIGPFETLPLAMKYCEENLPDENWTLIQMLNPKTKS